jgi:hypothetical protein
MGTKDNFSGGKAVWREADHSHLVQRSRMVELYLSSSTYLHGIALH